MGRHLFFPRQNRQQTLMCNLLLKGSWIFWEMEPVPPGHALFEHPRVVATPHMAAYTDEGRRRSHVAAVELVFAAGRGERPATLVNPAVWPGRRRGAPPGMPRG
ncbi:MAG: hypothetical protein ACKOUK_15340 [Verrucomicrobiota bacterium]